MCVELTDVEQKIFDKIKADTTFFDEEDIKKVIKVANVHGDCFKRVTSMSNPDVTYLVPIADIFLCGLKETDLGTKYTVVEENR